MNPNAETNAPTIAAVGISFTTLSLILVCLRFYVRQFMVKAVGKGKLPNDGDRILAANKWVDDWTIAFTWVS